MTQESKSKTPLPWMRNGQMVNDWWRIDGSSERVGMDFLAHPAAIVPDDADADFIVLACNSHAPLLAALEGLADEQALFAAQLPPIYAERLEAARKAIEDAKA